MTMRTTTTTWPMRKAVVSLDDEAPRGGDALEAVRAEVRTLARRLDRLERRTGAAGVRDDVQFVATIAATVQGCVFSAAELLTHAQVDAALAQVLEARTAVDVGRRLRALMGRDVGGWTVERIARDADGILWSVVPTPLHGGARLSGEDDV